MPLHIPLLTHDKSPKFKVRLRSPYGDPDKYIQDLHRLKLTAAFAKCLTEVEVDSRKVREYFVVGDTSIYDPELEEGTLVKKGRDRDYLGGRVFMTADEASHAIFDYSNYAVYVILCKPDDLYLHDGRYHLSVSVPVIQKWKGLEK